VLDVPSVLSDEMLDGCDFVMDRHRFVWFVVLGLQLPSVLMSASHLFVDILPLKLVVMARPPHIIKQQLSSKSTEHRACWFHLLWFYSWWFMV
jgi:hypothetical protein